VSADLRYPTCTSVCSVLGAKEFIKELDLWASAVGPSKSYLALPHGRLHRSGRNCFDALGLSPSIGPRPERDGGDRPTAPSETPRITRRLGLVLASSARLVSADLLPCDLAKVVLRAGPWMSKITLKRLARLSTLDMFSTTVYYPCQARNYSGR